MKLPAVWLCSAAGIIDVQLGYSSNSSSSKIQTQFTMIKKKKKIPVLPGSPAAMVS
jgi:hypothetical protein